VGWLVLKGVLGVRGVARPARTAHARCLVEVEEVRVVRAQHGGQRAANTVDVACGVRQRVTLGLSQLPDAIPH